MTQQAELPTQPKESKRAADAPRDVVEAPAAPGATGGTAPQAPPPAASANTTALAPIDDSTDPDAPSRTLSAFASEGAFRVAQRMARALADSTLMPKDYQNNIANCLIAMELANRIGASVLMVAQSLDIIHGRPSWRSQFLIATVNSSGRFTPIRYRWVGEEGKDSWGCRAYARDRESGEECVGAKITIGLAHAEGWTKKNGSKWATMPEQMLMYRAAAFWSRVYAPELSLGMRTTEEVIDTTGVEVHDLPAQLQPGSVGVLEANLRAQPAQVVAAQ